METKYGNKYNKDLDLKEISKEIRKDIKKTFGKEVKASVTSSRFAGGWGIDVKIKDIGFNPFSKEFLDNYEEINKAPWEFRDVKRYNDKALSILKEIEGIHDSYNFDGSDTQVDYFHVNYYGHVKFDYELEDKYLQC